MNTRANDNNQGRRTSQSQVRTIHRLAREGHSVQEICAELTLIYGPDAIKERSVQNYVRRVRNNQVPWERLDATGVNAYLVMEVLPSVIETSDGKKLEFTQEESEWIIWIRQIAPTLPPQFVWELATYYMTEDRNITRKAFQQLDAFLAYKPWESLEAMTRYDNLKEDGVTPDNGLTQLALGARAYLSNEPTGSAIPSAGFETDDEIQRPASGEPSIINLYDQLARLYGNYERLLNEAIQVNRGILAEMQKNNREGESE
ncbi:MAG: hypothetical protein VX966_05815 [Chloroflexota bacterium]|nr:hypothetical protein [Chloroflexota bacterium]